MLSISELKEGKCKVIAESNGQQKTFNGHYNNQHEVVFFTIPDHYEIIGYIQ